MSDQRSFASSPQPMLALPEPQKPVDVSALSRSALYDGMQLMPRGGYDNAIRIFHAALAADPNNPSLRKAIAQAANAKAAERSVLTDDTAEGSNLRSEEQSSDPLVAPNKSSHMRANPSHLASGSKTRKSGGLARTQDGLRIGRSLLARGDYDGAVRIFAASLISDPDQTELRDEIARADRAKATEEQVLGRSPDMTKP
jgi:tetratricopeptide (TPR) repeat protein